MIGSFRRDIRGPSLRGHSRTRPKQDPPVCGFLLGMTTEPQDHVSEITERAVAIANEILQGKTDPYPGAKQLWLLCTELAALEEELRPFVGLASEWEDVPAQREAYERDIIAAADRFRAHRGP